MSESNPFGTLARYFLWEIPMIALSPLILVFCAVRGAFKLAVGWLFEVFQRPE